MKQALYKQNELENNPVLRQFEAIAIFRISVVWRVGWWNLITSVRLIQVGNNRNDHFRYFLGVRVRLIEVSA